MVHMTVAESLLVSVYGMAVVFVVLIALCLFLALLSKINGAFKKKEGASRNESSEQAAPAANTEAASGELKLIDVDEKTAAIIMAIVSHESGIPLSELQFKSIKALD